MSNSTLTISIDDLGAKDHIAELNMAGELTFTYYPEDISVDKDIYMNYTLTANAGTYKGQPILTVDAGPFALGGGMKDDVTFLTAAELKNHIHLADITLATHDEYKDFETALAGTTITITVNEGVVTPDDDDN